MGSNPHFPVNLVTFTEVIFNGKLHFLCSDTLILYVIHNSSDKALVLRLIL